MDLLKQLEPPDAFFLLEYSEFIAKSGMSSQVMTDFMKSMIEKGAFKRNSEAELTMIHLRDLGIIHSGGSWSITQLGKELLIACAP